MEWQDKYGAKVITAENAATLVKSGDVVAFPVSSHPVEIGMALAKRNEQLRDVQVISAWNSRYPWHDLGMTDSFSVIECFGYRDVTRLGIKEGWIDWLPYLPGLVNGQRELEDDRGRAFSSADIAFITLSPPNKQGYLSFGHDVWVSPTLVRTAKIVAAQIDPKRVWTFGETVHISEIDYLVEPPAEQTGIKPILPIPPPEEAEKADVIGALAASLVRDGDTLQVGSGTASEAVFPFLSDKKDLGIDTEIIYPPTIDLIKSGVFSGKRKNVNRDRAIASCLWTYVGDPRSQPATDFLDGNPTFEMRDWSYICNVPRIASNDNMVAINSILSIDLLGQIVLTHLGPVPIVGPGGQVEYAIGAHYSRGGRNISVLISTAKEGTVSRIVPQFEPGTAVMLPAVYADYLVTEYGIVNLNNKSRRQRAEAVISVAHPDFRSELMREAKSLNLV